MGIHTKKSAPVKGGEDVKQKPLSVVVAQDTTPLVKFYWAPSQDTMNTAPLEYVEPDQFPVKSRPVTILRVVRLYYDGQPKPTPKKCKHESWLLVGVSGPYIVDAGYPRRVFAPEGLAGIAGGGVTYQYLIGNGDIAIADHQESEGDCQKSECWYGDMGLIDGSELQASTLLTLDDLEAMYNNSHSCKDLIADPKPNDSHGISTDPNLVRMGGTYAGLGKISLIGINFTPEGATSSDGSSGGMTGPAIGDAWKTAFEALKADLESTYENLYVTVINGKEDKFLELFTPAIDETDFVGFDTLHITVQLSRPGIYEDLSGAFVDYSNALQTQFEFFPRLRTVVYNDIGDPGDKPSDIMTFETFLTAAASELVDFGFEYGGEVNYHSPNTGDMRTLIVDHFKLDDD